MKIFLTNDDGFNAKGIRILDDVLTTAGHEVWVCAPNSQKSSTSHSLSDTRGKSLQEIVARRYSFDGQPADCVMQALGMKRLLVEPDLVVSGINAGFNLSIDILYSGTCGAASEAATWGYKAIALSVEKSQDGDEMDFQQAAHFLLRHLEVFHTMLTPKFYLNINVPHGSDGKTWRTGSKLKLVHRNPALPDDSGVMANGREALRNGAFDTDLAICATGSICVSPIMIAPGLCGVAVQELVELSAQETD
jgi:5'-nucleotidase